MSDAPYRAGYVGRTGHPTICVRCCGQIAFKQLRLGKVVSERKSRKVTRWSHINCFFEDHCPGNLTDFNGWDHLEADDKNKIINHIAATPIEARREYVLNKLGGEGGKKLKPKIENAADRTVSSPIILNSAEGEAAGQEVLEQHHDEVPNQEEENTADQEEAVVNVEAAEAKSSPNHKQHLHVVQDENQHEQEMASAGPSHEACSSSGKENKKPKTGCSECPDSFALKEILQSMLENKPAAEGPPAARDPQAALLQTATERRPNFRGWDGNHLVGLDGQTVPRQACVPAPEEHGRRERHEFIDGPSTSAPFYAPRLQQRPLQNVGPFRGYVNLGSRPDEHFQMYADRMSRHAREDGWQGTAGGFVPERRYCPERFMDRDELVGSGFDPRMYQSTSFEGQSVIWPRHACAGPRVQPVADRRGESYGEPSSRYEDYPPSMYPPRLLPRPLHEQGEPLYRRANVNDCRPAYASLRRPREDGRQQENLHEEAYDRRERMYHSEVGRAGYAPRSYLPTNPDGQNLIGPRQAQPGPAERSGGRHGGRDMQAYGDNIRDEFF